MAEGEISFEELTGVAPAKPAKGKAAKGAEPIAFEDMTGGSEAPPSSEGKKKPWFVLTNKGFKSPVVERALESSYVKGAKKAATEVGEAFEKNPRGTLLAAGKVAAASAVDLADLAIQGIVGVSQTFFGNGGKGLTEESAREFLKTKNATAAVTAKVRDVASKMTGVNLAPASKEEKAVADLLSVLPDAASVAGDKVYDKTGSALASGGIQAIIMLAGFKPTVAVQMVRAPYQLARKSFKGTPAANAAAQKVDAVIDELAARKPEEAKAIAKHFGEADPDLQKYIEEKVAQFSKASEEELIELGRRQASWRIKEKMALTEQAELQLGRAPDQGSLDLGEGAVRAQGALELEPPKLSTKVSEKGEPVQGEMDLYSGRGQNRELDFDRPMGRQLELKLEETTTGLMETLRQVRQELDAISLENRTPFKPKQIEVKRRDLPPIPQGMTRLFLSNKEGATGRIEVRVQKEDAERMGLPAPDSYRGQMAYVDVPTEEAARIGAAAPPAVVARSRPVPPTRQPVVHRSDPVLYTDNGQPVTRSRVESAFTIGKQLLARVPGLPVVQGKLSEYYQQIIRTLNPEAVGPEAQQAAAVLAKNVAVQMQRDSSFHHRAADRRRFWNQRAEEVPDFVAKYEKGEQFADPVLNKVAAAYKEWNNEIAERDRANGIDYDPVDNYLAHVFEDSDAVGEYFSRKYGKKWGDPAFMKDRSWDMYAQAVEAGYKPRFTNPEDIMLARQHASDIASMRVQTLRDLEAYGLAKKKGEDAAPDDFPATEWRSPNGERFWVHSNANAVMHNAFNTASLWSMKGMAGDAFRGAMFLKNSTVPVLLSFSLFHALHVATIHNVTGMVRAGEMLLAGKMPIGQALKELGQSVLYKDFIKDPKSGYRLLSAYRGKIADKDLTDADRLSLQYMAEGGMIPELAAQYKTNAIEAFKDAVQKQSVTAAWHAPFAAIMTLQKPMFEMWIPSLKIASYLKDVKAALAIDPKLLDDPLARQVAFRKIAKSVDNRYGEMAYSTLFWNRWVKDIGVASTLSLGWNLGFIREYGGGLLDIGQFAKGSGGGVVQKVKDGQLHRPLFVTLYSAQSMAYAGLLTWAFSGQFPSSLIDYLYPQSGEENPDGSPKRLTTMFYPREFAAISKHMEHEGVIGGLGHTALNKASPVMGLVHDWATNVDSFGAEISDPDAPAYQRLQQKLAYSLGQVWPISEPETLFKSDGTSAKQKLLNVAGFSPAPKYATETKTQGAIKHLYQTYHTKKQTPYERARFSQEARDMRKAYEAEDMERYGDLMDGIIDKYELSASDRKRLEQTIVRQIDPYESMFKRLTVDQQIKLLDKMTEEERDIYLPISNKQKVRFRYEPPEDRSK